MKTTEIINSLNGAIKTLHPELKGKLIARTATLPTKLNAFKKFCATIYYHISTKNYNVFEFEQVLRCPEGEEETTSEMFNTALLEQIFVNLNKIYNEIISI